VTTTASVTGVGDLLAQLTSCQVVDLEQPRFAGMPMFPTNAPNYAFFLHRRHEAGLESRTSAAGVIVQADHAGTHVDALCHQAEDLHMHGGVQVSAENQGERGMRTMAAESLPVMIRRGVLIDLAKAHGDRVPAQYLVERDELESVASAQGAIPEAGDILLVRTGWGAAWHDDDYLTAGGMARSSGEWAAERGVFAVGADNMSWDLPGYVDPVLGHSLPNHTILLVRAGILIFENLMLDGLSATGAHEFVFVSTPIKLTGATGSPTRPLALVPNGE
jgi:kynurenine formamidase